ncbi:MAG: 50S ribosome-binding GTPase, partial [Lachnospiraceae bacterium]|nr:50S ribosome-binding GTPase [Lachnospiraceae bacterium]
EEEVEFASREKLVNMAETIMSLTRRLAGSFADGSAIKDGIPVAIVGATNAGKSTLLNQLLHDDRAIVSDIHGTTRDTIEDTVEIGGVLFRVIDTAGLRQTSDKVEALGIERAMSELVKAKIVVWVIDSTDSSRNILAWESISPRLTQDHKLIIALNKVDLLSERDNRVGRSEVPYGTSCQPSCLTEAKISDGTSIDTMTGIEDFWQNYGDNLAAIVELAAKTGQGIDKLTEALIASSGLGEIGNDDVIVTNARHYEALVNATAALERVLQGLHYGITGDFIAQDIRQAIHHLGEITGEITTQDILSTIFSRFCIGK